MENDFHRSVSSRAARRNQHQQTKGCPIPVADDPNKIVIPEKRTPEKLVQRLSYITEDSNATNGSQSSPLFAAKSFSPRFGGHLTWQQREESFKIKPNMKVHCGFMQGGGEEMAPKDIEYVKKCKFVVATGIFDAYDSPHQPSNISKRSESLFCFLMVVDEVSLKFIRNNVSVTEDIHGGQWVGIWRLILLKHQPYDEPRRNGKVPKILTHRYLWRGKYTFAIAQHKHHRNIYEEADSNKRRKRYARPLIDLHMKIYRYEGLEPWSQQKGTLSGKINNFPIYVYILSVFSLRDSRFRPLLLEFNLFLVNADVPEGAIIIREHTALNNLFSCLWFNEVHLFTPRDQLSFGYVVYRLGGSFKFFMFPNCEYNSIFVLHPHNREHSSKIEWAKTMEELKKQPELIESRGGLGLWTPYPGNLDLVVMPPVARTSKAG
ncbi:hypothetical protein DH2020_039316 [Rehmannia glutinosa]|uniref:TOD1/MUCI70 glycosyltransferase-like domain-containing protein n=1 Tax=Rehmannia glutinosa TaxID=99300 RepID=A0ABR0UXU2_REHGL